MNREQLVSLLQDFRYQSSMPGRGERGLGQHHIDALCDYLLPYLKTIVEKIDSERSKCIPDELIDEAFISGWNSALEVAIKHVREL